MPFRGSLLNASIASSQCWMRPLLPTAVRRSRASSLARMTSPSLNFSYWREIRSFTSNAIHAVPAASRGHAAVVATMTLRVRLGTSIGAIRSSRPKWMSA